MSTRTEFLPVLAPELRPQPPTYVEPSLLAQTLDGLQVAMAELRACEAGLRAEHASIGGHHAVKDHFIYSLLRGQLRDEAAVLAEAQIFGMDFGTPRAVLLIDAADYILASDDARAEPADSQIWRRAQAVISSVVSFFHLPNDTICAYGGDGEVAVLKASNTRNLASWANYDDDAKPDASSWANLAALKRAAHGLRAHLCRDTGATVNIGIGRYHPGICELVRSHQDARAALLLGRRFHAQSGVHCLDSLGIAAFVGVADEQTKVDLATYLLSPLCGERELLATLDAFFAENCCPSQAATRLCIHRNTLSYRLDKISALSGLDPRRFDDAVQIRLALVLRALSDPRVPRS